MDRGQVKVLTDTHALVWALANPGSLSERARQVLTQSEVTVSVANLWELLLKGTNQARCLPIRFPGGKNTFTRVGFPRLPSALRM